MNLFQNILDAQIAPETPKPIFNYDDGSEDETEHKHIDDRKKEEEIRKLKIGNEKELGNLIDKKMIQAIVEEIGHSIQTNLVDLPRRESPVIAATLGVPEKEMELTKILSEKIEKAINAIIEVTVKYSKDEFYE